MTPAQLSELPLFAGLGCDDIEHLLHLMLPFHAPAHSRLFAEGETSDRMHLVREGHLRVSWRLPGGGECTVAEVGDGATLGELSLLVDGRRTATVTALADTHGWTLGRHGFGILRTDPRPAALTVSRRIGEIVIARLRERYEKIEAALGDAADTPPTPELQLPALAPHAELDCGYLTSLLCFRRFDTRAQVREAVAGRAIHELERGDELIRQGTRPAALHLVVRGAIEVSVARGHSAQRLRLAGPGRFVGHLGVLDDRPSPTTARARTRGPDRVHPQRRAGTAQRSRGGGSTLRVGVLRRRRARCAPSRLANRAHDNRGTKMTVTTGPHTDLVSRCANLDLAVVRIGLQRTGRGTQLQGPTDQPPQRRLPRTRTLISLIHLCAGGVTIDLPFNPKL